MDLKTEIFKECTKAHVLNISKMIGDNDLLFAELMDMFFDKQYATRHRISWIVTHCAEAHLQLIIPYFEKMILNLKTPKLIPAIKRNTLKIIADLNPKFSEELTGHALDICFEFLISTKEPVAIKVHAMQVTFNICKQEPELLNELKMVIEDQMDFSTAGFKSRGKKILKAIG
jgi:hypothetical protein